MRSLLEIQAWFVPRQVPLGAAPEEIKEQWVDVPLPLRQLNGIEAPDIKIGHDLGDMLSVHIREGVDVYAFDAIKALGLFGKQRVAGYWSEMISPEQGLIFGIDEGEVYPTPVIQRILPGIELFDGIE